VDKERYSDIAESYDINRKREIGKWSKEGL
jgi:hypothetical protein